MPGPSRLSGENSIFQIQSPTSAGSTPAGRPSTAALSATSANWVDEMNAELAEFDALAATRLAAGDVDITGTVNTLGEPDTGKAIGSGQARAVVAGAGRLGRGPTGG